MVDFIAYGGMIIDVRKLTPKPVEEKKEVSLISLLHKYQMEYECYYYKAQCAISYRNT